MDLLKKHFEWIPAIIIIVILGGSLPFKFMGAPITDHIFDVVGVFLGLEFFRTLGGYIIGSAELVVCLLLLVPKPVTRALGGLIAVGTMSGAIMFHLFSPLGVTVRYMENGIQQEDGSLFYTAILVWVLAAFIAFRNRKDLPIIGNKL